MQADRVAKEGDLIELQSGGKVIQPRQSANVGWRFQETVKPDDKKTPRLVFGGFEG